MNLYGDFVGYDTHQLTEPLAQEVQALPELSLMAIPAFPPEDEPVAGGAETLSEAAAFTAEAGAVALTVGTGAATVGAGA